MNPQIQTLRQHREDAERTYLISILPHFDTLASAASALGIRYNSLWRKMRKHGLSRD